MFCLIKADRGNLTLPCSPPFGGRVRGGAGSARRAEGLDESLFLHRTHVKTDICIATNKTQRAQGLYGGYHVFGVANCGCPFFYYLIRFFHHPVSLFLFIFAADFGRRIFRPYPPALVARS